MGGWSPEGKPSPPPNKKIKNKIQSLPIENKLCIPVILNNFCLKCHEAENKARTKSQNPNKPLFQSKPVRYQTCCRCICQNPVEAK